MNRALTALDKRILNRLQQDIPFTAEPWKKIAGELNIQEARLLNRIAILKKRGIIRRIAAVFNPRKVGFVSTLAAAKVAPENIEAAARAVNKYPEVTHNYKRQEEYNLWFALVAPSRKKITLIINRLKKNKKFKKVIELPAVRLFKIDVSLKV
ncbi:MAG: AsnC family protein [Candidatus Omnitrophica bacterium CG11_big_fil_rev_8_21_14_0_20_42_13]|uniref:siroheme decarboxylase n=1 Tax=Candidatus Ghiorseimicrobium undicola TaxID=1974746 RepID=A0A2H0LYQ0_9BACT|nr:MAG: AsnC family protein [Candidatus Omnitrophica bacterium CG11_big_fil_rev_8_21_14_0_20_42_13]